MSTAEITWHGSEALQPFLVPVGALQTHPHNPRKGHLPAIAESLDAFGQMKPIVSKDGVIYSGNHTYRAAVELLNWTHIATVDGTHLNEDELERYLIGDNRTSDLGTYDDDALSGLLARYQDQGRLVGTGYSADEVDDYLSRINRMEQAEQQEFRGGYLESPQEKEDRAKLMRHAENLRDFTLIYEESQAAQFGIFIRMLKHAHGTTGIADTVYRVVEDAAKAL